MSWGEIFSFWWILSAAVVSLFPPSLYLLLCLFKTFIQGKFNILLIKSPTYSLNYSHFLAFL